MRTIDEIATTSNGSLWEKVSKASFFIADVEHLQLVIHHSVQAPIFYEESGHTEYSKNSRELRGIFLPQHEHETWSNDHLFERGSEDKLSVNQFLAALGPIDPILDKDKNLTLEHISDVEWKGGSQTLRESGLIASVDIGYNNIRCKLGNPACAFGAVPISYRYRCARVPKAYHSEIELIPVNSTHRKRIVKYGIYLKFMQTGRLGRFSFSVLMLNIAQGLGMMTMAICFLDFVALYLVRHARYYMKKKYQEIEGDTQIPVAIPEAPDADPDTKKNK